MLRKAAIRIYELIQVAILFFSTYTHSVNDEVVAAIRTMDELKTISERGSTRLIEESN